MVQNYWNIMYPGQFRISVYKKHGAYRPVWKAPLPPIAQDPAKRLPLKEVALFHHGGHYDGIKSLARFFGVRNYCVECERPYHSDKTHQAKCKFKCVNCCQYGQGPCLYDGSETVCNDCKKLFYNRECYDRHRALKPRALHTICQTFHSCEQCGKYYTAKKGHQCGVRYCTKCFNVHDQKDGCFIRKMKINTDTKPYRLVFYDVESELRRRKSNKHCADDSMHRVNFVASYLCCSACVDNGEWLSETTGECKTCGPGRPRKRYWSAAEKPRPMRKFMRWLLSSFDSRGKTIAISHYGGRYDMHFALGEIYRFGAYRPQLIRNGNKIYQIRINRRKGVNPLILFKDSFNWMSLKLAALPRALGLNVEDKGYFPYLYNRKKHLHRQKEHLPKLKYYNRAAMLPKKSKEMLQWYRENKHRPFCLKEELVKYGMNDVMILAHAVVRFRQLFKELGGEDAVEKSNTAAGACQRHFLSMDHIGEKDIGIIPEHGYRLEDRQSAKGLKFLKWIAFNESLNVQHKDSVGGEYRYRNYKLDGYVKREGQRDLAIEFNGCAWHGHHCLYEEDDICPNGKTARKNREDFDKKRAAIEEEMELAVYWECQVEEMLEDNEEMSNFFKNCTDTGPIYPRDAFFGGRTGPVSLKCDLEESGLLETHEIKVLDFTSLYPDRNYHEEYPIGHPKELLLEKSVNWASPSDNSYKGIIKCFVLPPRNLRIPVIPSRHNGKLMFTLCNECAKNSATKSRRMAKPAREYRPTTLCNHPDELRGFVTTISHLELNLALEVGYRVTHLYSAYEWAADQWDSARPAKLFQPYVKKFMKIKAEASGWPANVGDDPERQQWYMDEYERRYGIHLEREKISLNEGLKWIAKLCLNTLWGRFAMRSNLTKTLITGDPIELHRILNDKTLSKGAIERIHGECWMVTYTHKCDFVRSHDRYNIALALFTTSSARVKLYRLMALIDSMPGCKLLYTDTDSVFFLVPKGQYPVETGNFLGELTDEYPDLTLLAYYCVGPKTYALKMRNKNGEIEHALKAKGITLNMGVRQTLNYNTYKELVDNFGCSEPVVVESTVFRPDVVTGKVTSRPMEKVFRCVYDKSMVDSELECYPFGYHGPF